MFKLVSDYKPTGDQPKAIEYLSNGILGGKYIEIEPGGSEDYITPGGEFTYTQDAMVLEELLDRIIGIGKANRNKNSNKDKEQDNE